MPYAAAALRDLDMTAEVTLSAGSLPVKLEMIVPMTQTPAAEGLPVHFMMPGTQPYQPAKAEVTSSMRAMTSGVSFGITSRAPRFSVSCVTFEAPVMTVLTRGFFATQAIAS